MILTPPHLTDSPIVVKTPPSLELPNPSLAQVAMEPHNNIPTLLSTKILYLIPIDLPTPTLIEVSKPLLVEVLVHFLFKHQLPSIIRYLSSSTEVPLISTIMDVCREAKESSKTLLQKFSKSIMQVKKDVKLQLYVFFAMNLLPSLYVYIT
jgi:hypothetical protein